MDLPLQQGTSKAGNPWKKKEWVLETIGQYPRKVKFDVFGDRVDTLHFELGQSYVVSVDVESREFNGRWYTDLKAFAVRPSVAAAGGYQAAPVSEPAAQPPYGTPAPAPSAPAYTPAPADESDDLPF